MGALGGLGEALLAQSDPANAALVGYVWWRLDTRLRELTDRLPEEPPDGR
jgi:hypothetical protein